MVDTMTLSSTNQGKSMSVYREMGYESRRDYLESLAAEMDIDVNIVFTLAQLLGPNEDFDGLVTSLEDEYA
jgi:hypothetical protein